MWWPVFVFVCMTSVASVNSANILAAIPTISRSHYVGFEALIKELVKRGHRVTSITTFPQKTPLENLREIDVREFRNVEFNNLTFAELTGDIPRSFFVVLPLFIEYSENVANVFNSTAVKSLISSEEKFDLIILENFLEEVLSGFAYKFDAPVVTVSSCYMFPWTVDRFGIPEETAYVPGLFSFYGGNMNFFQRLRNTFLDISGRLFFHYWLEPLATDISRSVFGPGSPAVRDLVKNTSVYMVNTHWSLFGARPLPPQVVDVSGIHLRPARPLHADLDKWMNESVGVVYFSFGSMLRGATLPADKVRAFLTVFGTLPQRVLWKWEDDTVAADTLPANVKIMKWLPQRDVLAHPKVRVFISHGGLLGTTEAVVSGVPILGIPMYGDQPNNVAALVERGVAIHIDYNNISVASLKWAFNTLLTDTSYAENAKQLAVRFLDRPMSPLDTAVYWTEYVIRHRGAPHLQSAAVHLTWYQYYLLDVAAVFLLAIFLTLTTIYYTLRSCLRLVMPTNSTKLKSN